MSVPFCCGLTALKSGEDALESAMIAYKMAFQRLSELLCAHDELREHVLHRLQKDTLRLVCAARRALGLLLPLLRKPTVFSLGSFRKLRKT